MKPLPLKGALLVTHHLHFSLSVLEYFNFLFIMEHVIGFAFTESKEALTSIEALASIPEGTAYSYLFFS